MELDETSSVTEIPLESTARFVDLEDTHTGRLVANCSVMDLEDLAAEAWIGSRQLNKTRSVDFEFRRPPGCDGLLLRVSLRREPVRTARQLSTTVAVRMQPWIAVTSAILLILFLAAGTVLTLRERKRDATKGPAASAPSLPRIVLSAVGPTLRLDAVVHGGAQLLVDWGDLNQPDPVGGTPVNLVSTAPDAQYPGRITHEYRGVPAEGLRTKVLVGLVNPANPSFPDSGRTRTDFQHSVWLLPYGTGILIDSAAPLLRIKSPSNGDFLRRTTTVQIEAGALTEDVHLLVTDPGNPTTYQYVGRIPAPPFGETKILSRNFDTATFQGPSDVRFVVISSNRFSPPAGLISWKDIPQSVPRDAIDARLAGLILSPREGASVKAVEQVHVRVSLPGMYAAAIVQPVKDGGYWVQNNGVPTNATTLSLPVNFGGRDEYSLYIGITRDPGFFRAGERLAQLPLSDTDGNTIFWIGPATVSRK